jgi:ribosomal protein S18 acetylase RimI-like enzyme
VPVRDPGALADALTQVLADRALRSRMGTAARRRAEAEFDQRRVVATVVGETERLLRLRGIGGACGSTVVRRARKADARAMGRLHASAMPTAFLPTLGEGFLTQLYRELATDPSAVALVAARDGLVIGFAAGVRSVDSFYRRFALRRGAVAALEAAPRLRDPGVRASLRETAGYQTASSELPAAEVLAIGVDERARGTGVGRALAEGVLRGLDRRGVAVCKVVVGADNESANRFYEALGFRRVSTIEVHEGTDSYVWVAECRS